MKLQHTVLAILALVSVSTFTACKKEDKTAPKVTVTAPLDGASFAVGASIDIVGTVTDETALKEVVVEVTNASTDAVLYTKTITVTGKSATVNANYVVAVVSGTNIEVHIEATDEAGNTHDEHAHLHVN
jgi:hypothetical protein